MSEEDKIDKDDKEEGAGDGEMTQTDGVNQVLLCPISAQPETKGAFRQRLWEKIVEKALLT